MGDLIDAAASILDNTEKRLDLISNNISNISTPGFKKNLFINHVPSEPTRVEHRGVDVIFGQDTSQGLLKETGKPLDISISGDGYFLVRQDDLFYLTRTGRFMRGPGGVLQTGEGLVLQLAGGGDAVVETGHIEILADGTLIDDQKLVGAIGVYKAPAIPDANGLHGTIQNPTEADAGTFEIRQRMLESSNVVLSDEMTALMANMRQAEGAAQLVRAYDQLIGQAVATFGKAGR